MKLNFTEVAELMKMTSAGAKKRIVKYEDDLKDFIYYDNNGNIIGFDDLGIENLRIVGRHNKSTSIPKRDLEIEHLNSKIELLEQQIRTYEGMIRTYDSILQTTSNENERLHAENRSLLLENEELRKNKTIGFFSRLLGNKNTRIS